jgi:hypothetical protein
MCCWRSDGEQRWADSVRSEEELERVQEERNILQTVKGRKEGRRTGDTLRRNCHLKQVIERKIEGRI